MASEKGLVELMGSLVADLSSKEAPHAEDETGTERGRTFLKSQMVFDLVWDGKMVVSVYVGSRYAKFHDGFTQIAGGSASCIRW